MMQENNRQGKGKGGHDHDQVPAPLIWVAHLSVAFCIFLSQSCDRAKLRFAFGTDASRPDRRIHAFLIFYLYFVFKRTDWSFNRKKPHNELHGAMLIIKLLKYNKRAKTGNNRIWRFFPPSRETIRRKSHTSVALMLGIFRSSAASPTQRTIGSCCSSFFGKRRNLHTRSTG